MRSGESDAKSSGFDLVEHRGRKLALVKNRFRSFRGHRSRVRLRAGFPSRRVKDAGIFARRRVPIDLQGRRRAKPNVERITKIAVGELSHMLARFPLNSQLSTLDLP